VARLRPIDRHLALGEAYAHIRVLEGRGDINVFQATRCAGRRDRRESVYNSTLEVM